MSLSYGPLLMAHGPIIAKGRVPRWFETLGHAPSSMSHEPFMIDLLIHNCHQVINTRWMRRFTHIVIIFVNSLNTFSGGAPFVPHFAMCRSSHSETDKVEFKTETCSGLF